MSEQELEKRMEEIRKIGDSYAKAKATLNLLENKRKIELARMMKLKMSGNEKMSVAKADLESRSTEKYLELCIELSQAVEEEQRLWWERKIIEMKFDYWKVNQFAVMSERKKYGA